ncbi:hypothetical protein NPX13_g9076 [Xylaria arbuscula]|uniref:Uncharacterized protein n=1 Tax=Xylaria arbuscula TaxID=114810 RepID=A0A9W8TIU2_9PEZI|nr:hypothetical protein NPX13_g9076 [Xylaria arbuscula]
MQPETTATQPADSTENATTATATELSREDVDPVKKEVHNSSGRENSREVREVGMKKAPKRRLSRAPVGDDVDELGDEYVEIQEAEYIGEEERDGLQVVKHRKTSRENKAAARAGKVASRRRSTLSPWELHGLISGAVESPRR